MKRNIPLLMERFGGWAASDSSGVDYSHIAAGFKGLLPPSKGSHRLSCSDSDGLIIDGCMCQLAKKRPEEHKLLVAHYIYGIPKRQIAKRLKRNEKCIRVDIQLGEGFIDGCLSMVNLVLDMDIK
ncbi:antitermination protein Q [Rosenbergiella epipactidis]|uniref:antiterminator Q family protein n=1 Tax=Rosenbergiella epipactidis TaxID=1544694 RepID=UPI001BDA7CC5|nr:antiterminator Q family protein [Rosenbergiella epipactidis]MBT0717799.1 antitermination protein Q [Rosenbergiella epipactidis]